MPSNVVFRHDNISNQLYNDLLNSILAGDFPPLSSLPTEINLVNDYGIPRTTVRSALAQLKDDGFIISRQGSGTIVADQKGKPAAPSASVDNIADLQKCLECRIELEPGIAQIAAEQRSEEDVVFLRNHIIALEQLSDTAVKQSAEDADFHQRLAEISGNKFFVYIMKSLQPHILFGMNLVKTLTNETRQRNMRLSLLEHQEMVQAIIEQNGEQARKSMYKHLRNSQERVFGKN